MSEIKTKHPKALYTLFTTEMWERFSYYGMRALLTLYLTAKLADDGFGLERQQALALYAIFTGLVYLTPILGGWIADKFLGKRKTVYIGGFVMAVGQFLLAASAFGSKWGWETDQRMLLFNLGLAVLIVGNGFFKPNISTIVGDFYDDNDPRKDSAFNIFYMGINLGAILGPFIAGSLGEKVFWGWGFFSAGVGMIIGVLWLFFHEYTLENKGLPPGEKYERILGIPDWIQIIVWTAAVIGLTIGIYFGWSELDQAVRARIVSWGFGLGFVGISYVIIKGLDDDGTWLQKFIPVAAVVLIILILDEFDIFSSLSVEQMKYLGIGAGVLFLVFVVMLMRSSHEGWSRMGVIITLAVFNVAFWAGFEQAGGTMNLFAYDNTDRQLSAVWAPGFLQSVSIRTLGILAGIMLVFKLIQLYVSIYSDDENKKAKLAPLGKIGLYGTLFFGFLALWNYLSTGPEIPASWFQNINPFAILVFAPLFSVMWLKLDAMGLNPRTPIKFALGLFLGALAFFIMTLAYNKAQTGVLVSPMWLVVVYVVLTLGELMLSPIGLSMITKLADAKIVSIVMGLWMASFAAGNYIAGMLEGILEGLRDKGIDMELYPFLTYVMIVVGVILLILSPLMNRAMKGIH